MRFNKVYFANFRADVKEALKSVEEKYGVEIECGNITYSEDRFDLKIKAVKAGVDIRKIEFERLCYRHGLKPEDYGREFIYEGNTYKITGINKNAKTYPIITKKEGSADNTETVFTASSIKEVLSGGTI